MARIRTIKPEFPQSESMGRVSRDARLLFMMLWTICDDHGRARAHSRMLASLLFPYDDDAGEGVPIWLDELENEGCIKVYEVDGSTYLQVMKWSKHQKIDKPSKPQFPAPPDDPREDSRVSRERSSEEGIKEGKGREEDKSPTGDSSPALPDDDASGDEIRSPEIPNCPHGEIIAAYHEALPMLRQVRDWTDERKALLRARWREDRVRQEVGWWREFFGYVATCPLLVGDHCSKDHPGWQADLEWLVRPRNFVKVIEGKYQPSEVA